MRIILKRTDECVEIDGDDGLIADDLGYRYSFERSVKQVTEQFYKKQEASHD